MQKEKVELFGQVILRTDGRGQHLVSKHTNTHRRTNTHAHTHTADEYLIHPLM